jgi:hypothetical protein
MLSMVVAPMFNKGFSPEESLVASDDDIWKSEQPREHIVAKNQPRTILKKDFFFLLVNIEAEITDLAALQR